MRRSILAFLSIALLTVMPAVAEQNATSRVNEIILDYAKNDLQSGDMSVVLVQTWSCFRQSRLMVLGADFRSRGATEADLRELLDGIGGDRDGLYADGFDIGEVSSPSIDAYFANCLMDVYEPYEKK